MPFCPHRTLKKCKSEAMMEGRYGQPFARTVRFFEKLP
ncbi:unnamed protein product [Penicillium camemberti]|uniref:Str. FM013 n=1 Tax=Penicillium camemberti (strain FM 013) TaxID=1429867 RepID=A0A0G4P9I9_PENC3|nr:unnamed protein product [Penicillium camemberti]